MNFRKPFGLVIVLCSVVVAPQSRADDLNLLINDMLKSNGRLAAAAADTEGARNMIEVARGGWYPTITPTINYGYERYNKPSGSDDTNAYRNEYTASL
ncbi:MAG: hypothetical protein EPN20_11240, partial [Magnetospirillum sp.]